MQGKKHEPEASSFKDSCADRADQMFFMCLCVCLCVALSYPVCLCASSLSSSLCAYVLCGAEIDGAGTDQWLVSIEFSGLLVIPPSVPHHWYVIATTLSHLQLSYLISKLLHLPSLASNKTKPTGDVSTVDGCGLLWSQYCLFERSEFTVKRHLDSLVPIERVF